MTDIGELKVTIKADAAQLDREMRKANTVVTQSAGTMGTAIGGLKAQMLALAPALGVSAFIGFAKSALDAADQLDDFRKRTGFAVESLSALKTPLLIADSNLEEFSASIARMNNLVGEAATGINETAVKAFDDLGLSITALNKLSPEQQFYEIARALGQLTSQSEFTNKGMAIFGRSFVNIAPLIKDAGGEVEGFVEKAKQMGGVVTQDQVDRIGDLNDRWTVFIEDTKKGMLELIPLLERLANVPKYVEAAFVEIPYRAGQAIGSQLKGGNPNVSEGRPASVDFAVFTGDEQYGPTYRPQSAKGSNANLLNGKERDAAAKQIADARAALEDYNRAQREEIELLQLSDREAAVQEARFKIEEIARKGNITLTKEEIALAEQNAARNYDLKQAQDELAASMREAEQIRALFHDRMAAGLTDIIFRTNSAKDAMRGFAEAIARAAFEKKIAGPLVDGLVGSAGKSGFIDAAASTVGSYLTNLPAFAEGGRPPVGVPSIVGERGPEIFMPDTAGTVIPNHRLGGSSVTVYQTFQINPGVPELINQEIRRAAPSIASAAHAAVFADIERGGKAARAVGRR